MPVLLFRLNGVPDDEANEIRELLRTEQIDFYETAAGRWGISLAAIWLQDHSPHEVRARQLIDDYQTQRQQTARTDYLQRRQEGIHETFLARLQAKPLQLLAYLAAILLILYLTLMPFLSL